MRAIAATNLLAPWLYAASQFAGRFAVHYSTLEYFPEVDSWYARFAPIPVRSTDAHGLPAASVRTASDETPSAAEPQQFAR